MKFFNFHLMPYRHADLDAIEKHGTAWVTYSNRDYDPHLHKWLHRIDVPTHVIWGADDRLFPKDYALAYQHLIPGSKLTIIPECGHVPPIEQPQALLAALEGFLEGKRVAA